MWLKLRKNAYLFRDKYHTNHPTVLSIVVYKVGRHIEKYAVKGNTRL